MIEAYLALLDLGYYEAQFAFEGLADENVWKRPSKDLLSVGELAGHTAYWLAMRFTGDGAGEERDVAKLKISSPLIHPHFRYYPCVNETPLSAEHLAMTAEQVWAELKRVKEEAVEHFKALNVTEEGSGEVEFIKYAVFHVSYHVGQMYTVRHLLGEETPDN